MRALAVPHAGVLHRRRVRRADERRTGPRRDGVVAVLAAGWLTWFLLVRPVTDRTALLYAFGLAVLAAALVVLSPWYGFFSFIGYLNALTLLTGAARYALVLVTAATAAASQIGGVWNIQGAGIVRLPRGVRHQRGAVPRVRPVRRPYRAAERPAQGDHRRARRSPTSGWSRRWPRTPPCTTSSSSRPATRE